MVSQDSLFSCKSPALAGLWRSAYGTMTVEGLFAGASGHRNTVLSKELEQTHVRTIML